MHAAKFILQHSHGLCNLETLHDNVFWQGAAPRISVCIPAFRHDASPLIEALSRCEASGLIEIIVYDDGSRDHDLLARMEANAGHAHAAVRIVSCWSNRGRAAARNAAVAHARADWILLLDADMVPDSPEFIETYLNAIDRTKGPCVVVGGHSLRSAPRDKSFALHRWQADCAPARHRRKAPERHLFSSNVLAHRAVFPACPFDEGFAGWGWEDADWGFNALKAFPVVHIDDTATHTGLDADEALMGKYARSVGNFARLANRHPAEITAMPLFRTAKRVRNLPFRKPLKALAASIAKSQSLPLAVRGRALKAWRAFVHAEAL